MALRLLLLVLLGEGITSRVRPPLRQGDRNCPESGGGDFPQEILGEEARHSGLDPGGPGRPLCGAQGGPHASPGRSDQARVLCSHPLILHLQEGL